MMSKNRTKTFDHQLTLIDRYTTTRDENDIEKPTETRILVYCKVLSVGSSETYLARQSDIFLSKKFAIHSFEYTGEKEVEFEGKRYNVVRVYGDDLNEVELTCEAQL